MPCLRRCGREKETLLGCDIERKCSVWAVGPVQMALGMPLLTCGCLTCASLLTGNGVNAKGQSRIGGLRHQVNQLKIMAGMAVRAMC